MIFKRISKIVFFIIICITAFQGINASELSNDTISRKTKKPFHNFLQIGVVGSHFSVRDAATSPLIYSGLQKGAQLGILLYSEKIKYNLEYNFLRGHLTSRNFPDNDTYKTLSYCNYLDIGVQKRLFLSFSSKWRLWVGAGISAIANIRSNTKFDNANLNYDGFASLGTVFSLERVLNLEAKQFNLGIFKYPLRERNMKLVFSAIIPVFTEAYRPDYSVIDDFVDGGRKVIDVNRLTPVSFCSYLSGTFKTEVFYFLHNQNMFKFGYIWNYYKYTPEYNNVAGVNGSISVSIVFRLNNK